MRFRNVTAAVILGTAFSLGGWWAGSRDGGSRGTPSFGPTPALAGDVVSVKDGETFVSTDGGAAYLWRRRGERIELVGQCVRTVADGSSEQATFVWLPGVERRS